MAAPSCPSVGDSPASPSPAAPRWHRARSSPQAGSLKSRQPVPNRRRSSSSRAVLSAPGQVHLVDKQEHRHVVALQQPPQGFRVALHPVGAADHQNGVVHHLQSPAPPRRRSPRGRGCPAESAGCRGALAPPAWKKMVMPLARSKASVSRKALRWSTRPSFRSAPAR